MRILKNAAAAAVIAAATLTTGASANVIVDLDKQGSSTFGSPAWKKNVTITTDGQSKRVAAGLFRLTDGVDQVLAFCIEPETFLNLGEDFDTTDTSGDWSDSWGEIVSLFETSYEFVVDARTAAGFQVALWEIVVEDDNNYDLSAGDFSVSAGSGVLNAANQFLAMIGQQGTGAYNFTTFANSGQDLITAETPIPAAALLFAPALGALAMRKRKTA
ncbi:hypothetical protein [Parvularcula maris]|uniref:VPLPA-CTERM sorting domain-containing protein n=1 Tax=Parvularcula maris TaxID=2965077 RepID=A0A9X2RJ86_9PROT|nr:hypothetical protein [Parvularcula maris]MCQ8185686.1 hypothetical protein [Parvularcula maris]